MNKYGEIYTGKGPQRVKLKKHGELWVRDTPDFGNDKYVLTEFNSTYKRIMSHVEGHSIVDIGSHIGMFTVKCMAAGAKSSVCYEPDPGAFGVLRENVAQFGRKVKAINQAVGKHDGDVILAMPYTGNSILSSTHFQYKRRTKVEVKKRGFNKLVEEHKPTLLKIDCEGAELEFLDGTKLPKHVEIVCGELHRWDGEEAACKRIIKSFAKWVPIHKPAGHAFNRCWLVAWSRT